ncbi:hypothetical protein [Streptomyces sp. HNM0574]|uniref:beta family protein n=1 Tax=Streptomyces sp. HNM0574 TaxID=2714954 RepID=UPI00146EE030|nr:hypothetical protein [Streptomyces sp. HNM0574]NLU68854.1 hypothetical protein [Streptomyces sp. HNM0574]
MSGPLYVPVLPARRHAARAYGSLPPDARRAVLPLWVLPPRTLAAEALTGAVGKDLRRVTTVQRHRPAWLDAPFADAEQIRALGPLLSDTSRDSPLRPVTGPGRPAPQQALALETAHHAGDGLGVRVPVPREWDDGETGKVRELLSRARGEDVDLLLDLGAVLPERTEAGKEALRALADLVPLAPWRTVVTIGGGIPRVGEEMLMPGLHETPRTEWRLWRELAAGRAAPAPLGYGDYGIQPVDALDRDPQDGNARSRWGMLRCTTDETYVFTRTLNGREAHNREAARRLLALPGFRGPAAGPAETWLRDCAEGTGGAGNHEMWLRTGTGQHLTYVARCLRA